MEDEHPPAWFTESQQAPFKIGDEVTVTLNGECRRGVLHGEQEIGVRGIVIGLEQSPRVAPGHTVWVHFRHPLPVVGSSSFYTPGELVAFDPLSLFPELPMHPAQHRKLTKETDTA